VVNLVARGTIEERVLRTLEAKQGLFAGVFEGDADEIPFEAVRTSSFLDSMRDLVNGDASGVREPPIETPAGGSRPLPAGLVSNESIGGATGVRPPLTASNPIWHGIAQLLEAACATLSEPAMSRQIPPELREKLHSAARKIADQLASHPGPK
jgi:hypothetical protein